MADLAVAHSNAIINTMRGSSMAAWTPYLALFNGDPRAGGAELVGSGMARIQLTGLGAPSNGEAATTSLLSWPVTSIDLGPYTHVGVLDALTSGTLRIASQVMLSAAERLVLAGVPVTIPAGALVIRFQ